MDDECNKCIEIRPITLCMAQSYVTTPSQYIVHLQCVLYITSFQLKFKHKNLALQPIFPILLDIIMHFS